MQSCTKVASRKKQDPQQLWQQVQEKYANTAVKTINQDDAWYMVIS